MTTTATDPADDAEPPAPRRIIVRLNPALNLLGSPLRRALEAAGIPVPFDFGGTLQAATPTDPTTATPHQETQTP